MACHTAARVERNPDGRPSLASRRRLVARSTPIPYSGESLGKESLVSDVVGKKMVRVVAAVVEPWAASS